jgi:hypothetical protein
MKISARQTIWTAAALALVLVPATIARAESVGTSQADLPSYSGAFSIENTTGVTIPYQVRWGADHPWKTIRLQSGTVETHSFPLGSDPNTKVPTPHVRFDKIGGDNVFEAQEYRMEFYAIGYAGFGPKKANTEPKPYVFRYASDGKHLDLKAK